MEKNLRIAVIGGGSWASAITKILLNNCNKVNWFLRSENAISYLKKHGKNQNYLPTLAYDISKINFFNNLDEVVENSDLLIFAVPSAFLKETLSQLTVKIKDKYIFSAIKGIIAVENLTISEYFNTHYKVPFSQIGVIAGPCHAEEVAMEKLSYLTIAAEKTIVADLVAERIGCGYIKTRFAKDIIGTEYAAVLKNIFAIASGICHGLGYGDNFQAVLVSNSIREMKRFLDKTCPNKRKINSSVYLGDLLVTTYSQFSRNRTLGMMIGKGYSVKSAMIDMNMIAEGYFAALCIHEMNASLKIEMPIAEAVYNILYEKISPSIEVKLLTEKLR